MFYFEFPEAVPTPPGISCHIERSVQIDDWSVIASKETGSSPWTGPTPVETLPDPGGLTIARVPAQSGPGGKVFYRLRVVQASSTTNP